MAKSESIQVRVEPEVKREADALFEELGIPTATAITVFLKTAIREHGFPFEVKLNGGPNRESAAAMEEADEIINGSVSAKKYTSAAEMVEDLIR